ncbi:hypothetical protein HLH17_11670 [Acinetobacter sp. ANC 5380]|uniref:Uncharacterized protein n=1 Tax=Acinetobacter terrae TaxID=2731247 RepID=A0A7Y2RGF5_9GAMM|nr:hypothetical protein [Acinetobacter terrae]NNH78316.1 hypothetical protein [Acinetobacter terrae]
MGIFDKFDNWLKKNLDRKEFEKREKYWNDVRTTADELVRIGLSCKKCNTISIPVFGTESHYCCLKCGNRFLSKKHNFALKYDNLKNKYFYICPHYDESIDFIKKYRLNN